MSAYDECMSGEHLANLSLRLDAIYCLIVGVVVAAASSWASTAAEVPQALLLAMGGTTATWGILVWWLASRQPPQPSLRWVMGANIAASGALAVTGTVADASALALGALVLSVDVGAFAVSQGIALRRIATAGH
jgi:hypothetical protein